MKNKGQSITEYIVTFTVLAIVILGITFFAFNPEKAGIKASFEQAVNNAVGEINK